MTPTLAALLLLAAPQPSPPSFGVEVASVYVDVFVHDQKGPLLGLAASDFELLDDGVRRPVELLAADALPLPTFLLFDTSESVDGEKLRELQLAGRAFLRGLRPGDEAAFLAFDSEVRLRVPLTADMARLERGLNGVLPGGATAAYDALYAGLTLASAKGRSQIVLFSDGGDNVSWLRAGQLAEVVERSDAIVHVVGVDVPAAPGIVTSPFVPRNPGGSIRAKNQTPWLDERVDAPPHVRFFRQLAESTGGRFWTASTPERLTAAFAAILEAMKTRYVLRYTPEGERRAGLHRLEVRLTRKKGRLHYRRTYSVAATSP